MRGRFQICLSVKSAAKVQLRIFGTAKFRGVF